MANRTSLTLPERVGHFISWIILFSIPVGAVLMLTGWLPHFFGDLGALTDAFLVVLIIVFVHGIVRAGAEPQG